MTIRRLGPGDEEIVVQLGGERPLTHAQAADLLADERTLYLVAFDHQAPIGNVFAHQLPRRHRDPSQLVLTNSSNDPALSFYRSLGGARPNEDDAISEFDYPA